MKIMETKDSRTTWSYLREKDHPIWGLMKTLLIAGCCALYLSFNAQNWDGGETRTVILTWLTSVIFEGVNVGRKA